MGLQEFRILEELDRWWQLEHDKSFSVSQGLVKLCWGSEEVVAKTFEHCDRIGPDCSPRCCSPGRLALVPFLLH